jgi:hypothetical protein
MGKPGDLRLHPCIYIDHEAGTWRGRRDVRDARANTENRELAATKEIRKMALTSVTIMPANGPKNTVYPFMKARKPVALSCPVYMIHQYGVGLGRHGGRRIGIYSLRQYCPGDHSPASNKRTNDLPAPDIDVAWAERRHIVTGRE